MKVNYSFEDMQTYLSGRMAICDGIRGVAILMVIIAHTRAARIPLPSLFDGFYGLGWCGVDLFFVLSGFLITGILYSTKNDPGYFKLFYMRRFLRIFPLYYLVLSATFWVLPLVATLAPSRFSVIISGIHGSEAWYWCYLSNIGKVFFNVQKYEMLGVVWSLAIEEQFYVFWPLVVKYFSRKTLIRICLGGMIFCFLLRILLTIYGMDRYSIYTLTFTRFDALACGALIALALRDREWFSRCWSLGKLMLPIGIAGFTGAAILGGGFSSTYPAMQLLGFTSLALIFGALLILGVSSDLKQGWLSRFLCFPLLARFGGACYGLYLLHMWLILPLRPVFLDNLSLDWIQNPIFFQSLFTLIMLPLCFIVSWMSWKYFESPILKLKRFFEYDKSGLDILIASAKDASKKTMHY